MELEDELSLDELLRLYEGAMERQNRLIKTVALAMGAEINDDAPSSSSSVGKSKPAYMIDPKLGGEATPAYGENEIAELPINIGYSTISKDE